MCAVEVVADESRDEERERERERERESTNVLVRLLWALQNTLDRTQSPESHPLSKTKRRILRDREDADARDATTCDPVSSTKTAAVRAADADADDDRVSKAVDSPVLYRT